jgi:hypothetical protein
MTRRNISSGAPWEETVGYSRAVRIGNVIEVAGTTAVDERGAVVGPNDPYLQARYALEKIGRALYQIYGMTEAPWPIRETNAEIPAATAVRIAGSATPTPTARTT